MPKVSVIVPVYNSSLYLADCLNSLTNQTLKDIEIIVIDDNSTDNSREIITAYQEKYPHIHAYYNDKNRGVSYTRNRGINLAHGEYIAFLDSDDYVHPKMYEDMYNKAIENNVSLVSCNIMFVKSNTYLYTNLDYMYTKNGHIKDLRENRDFIYTSSPSVCNKLIKKSLALENKFLEGISMYEDIDYSFSLLMQAKVIYEMSMPYYFYRRNITKGLSSLAYKPNVHIYDIFKVCDNIQKRAQSLGYYSTFRHEIQFLQIAYSLLRIIEIDSWLMEDNIKKETIDHFYNLITKRYGTYHQLDRDILSSKVDIDKIDNLRRK